MDKDLLAQTEQTVYVFAARYTHHRATGGTYAVTRALALVWDRLSDNTKKQIEEEAYHEATKNREDWARFFHWNDQDLDQRN